MQSNNADQSTQVDGAISPRDALINAFQSVLAEFDARPEGFPLYCRIEIDVDPYRVLGFGTTKFKTEIQVPVNRLNRPTK